MPQRKIPHATTKIWPRRAGWEGVAESRHQAEGFNPMKWTPSLSLFYRRGNWDSERLAWLEVYGWSVLESHGHSRACALHQTRRYFQLQPPASTVIARESESEVAQSCPTLCDPMDCSLSSSSIHGIFQAIVLEWIAIFFSRESSRPRDRTQVSRIVDTRFTVWAREKSRSKLSPPSDSELALF